MHCAPLEQDDCAERDGIPVTSVARTLLDVAAMVDEARLGRALEDADRLGILDLAELDRRLARAPRRRGCRALRRLLAQLAPAADTRSALERGFLEFCRDERLPEPACNVLVEDALVDAYWPDARLVVELDGWEFHRTHAAFVRDRSRDMRLQAAGIAVLPVTAARLRAGRADLAATIRRIRRDRLEPN